MKNSFVVSFSILFLIKGLLFSGCAASGGSSHRIENGEVSYSLVDLNEGVYPLDGQWEFYWGKHIAPEEFTNHTAPEPDLYMNVPGSWQSLKLDGKRIPSYGIATFRIVLHLPDVQKTYGLMFSSIAPAYTLYLNGNLQLAVGNPSANLEEVTEQHYTGTNYFTARDAVELVLQVSNRSEKVTGVTRHLYFGLADKIASFDSNSVMLEAVFLGIIFIIGLYHFIYWIIQRRDVSVLFFSILCVLISIRIAIEGMHILFRIIPSLSWETSMKLNFLTYFSIVPLFYSYFARIYPESFNRKLSRVFWGISLVLSIPVLVSRLRIYDPISYPGHVLAAVVIFLIMRGIIIAIRQKKQGAVFQLIAFSLFFLTTINDVLYIESLIVSLFLARYGLFVIILTQAFMIAREYGDAYHQMQKLLKEREGIQLELEEKVKERTRQLEQSNEAKMAFLRNMSHEMRTPINGIIGFAEILPEVTKPEELPYYASLILDESDHLISLINQLLDLAKIEAGKLELFSSVFNLRETIFSIEPAIKIQAENKGLEFKISVDPLLPVYVTGDRVRYRQILFNLLGNALKFTDEGEINLNVKREKDDGKTISVYSEVRDTGIGIPEEKQSGIFNLFEQADSSSKRRFGGTGLGTAIARELVLMMNGDINFHSIEGTGSVFWFTVMFGKADAEYVPRQSLTVNSDSPSLHHRHILLVEDYPTNQNILKRHLEKAGYIVWLANNGMEGVTLFRNHKFDLVVMDIQMPVMDGYEATELIRQADSGRNIPVIGLTASAFEEDRQKGLKSGMNLVLTKPVRKARLLSAIADILAPLSQSEKT